jgi:SNF2 family DNA or RNA helicase
MQYNVVYTRCISANPKRKRFEKPTQQLDGILLVHPSDSLLESKQKSVPVSGNQKTESMTVTLFQVHQPKSESDTEASFENDDSDLSGEEDHKFSAMKKRNVSWNKRRRCADHCKNKSSKQLSKNASKHNTNNTGPIVYAAVVKEIRRSNSDDDVHTAPNSSLLLSFPLNEGDVLVLDRFEVQILAGLRCNLKNDTDNVTSTIKQYQPPVGLSRTKVVASIPVRRIVSVPLQSKSAMGHDSYRHNAESDCAASTKRPPLIRLPLRTLNAKVPIRTKPNPVPISNGVKLQPNALTKKSVTIAQLDVSCFPQAGPTALPHIPLPATIRTVLKPHQIQGVDFLWRTLAEKKGCILGDEMGLGVRHLVVDVLVLISLRYCI